ncbi:Alpha/Beta hydrolase protein [Jimgerdemannia flammicorona]|uniref:Alpha/Beta hydrolase protein n=1 Tax=Jimgerdemannia flammicorona TaxID=994334 RepID=A0A433DHP4_9FUNG|nr:Alpha/Beta hydrolase protein [Jimgerdemannia flammicorona]
MFTTVQIPPFGTLRGNVTTTGVRQFLNIPYARIPKRWRAPEKLTAADAWQGERDATRFGFVWVFFPPYQYAENRIMLKITIHPSCNSPQCPQPPGLLIAGPYASNPDSNEMNCLNLNIYAPERKNAEANRLFPVMVWIHGGSFKDGTANCNLYDSTNFIEHALSVSRPVVVVTVNYRLNVFGFMGSRDIEDEMRKDPSVKADETSIGNWGLLDQKIAFEWVKDNINQFGGDPDQITAFGESAGGGTSHLFIYSTLLTLLTPHHLSPPASLHYHLINPAHHGLFRRVIMQSGVASIAAAQPLAVHHMKFDALCSHFGIPATAEDRVQRLRDVPSDQIISALAEFRFSPTIDGVVVPADVRVLWRQEGAWDPKVEAVMIGDTKDEGTVLSVRFQLTTLPRVMAMVDFLVPASLQPRFRILYSTPTTDAEAKQLMDHLFYDAIFHSPMRNLLAHLSATRPGLELHYYHFRHALDATAALGLGVHHQIELPFLFLRRDSLTEKELRVAERMVECWVRFAYGEGTGFEPFREGTEGKAIVFGEDGEVRLEREVPREENEKAVFWADVEKESARIAGEAAKAKI